MSAEFTTMAHEVLQTFDAFIGELLQGNANFMDNILRKERESGAMRMEQTKAQMVQTIGTLLNYTRNTTAQSQLRMDAMVDTFGTAMAAVVADFKAVAKAYASKVRYELALKVATAVANVVTVRSTGLQRFQMLYGLGILNFSKVPWDPIDKDDCVLLGAICGGALELGIWETLSVVSANGRFYMCIPGEYALISVVSRNGSRYNEDYWKWLPDVPVSNYMTTQRCMSEAPAEVVRVGQDCPLPLGCQCGADQRCSAWYRPQANATRARLEKSDVFIGKYGVPQVTVSYPVFDPRATPPRLLAVASSDFVFTGVDYYLSTLRVANMTTYLAVLLNDTNLTTVGSFGHNCAKNDTPPGDPNLPTWSGLRSCDPRLRAVAQWVAAHRGALPPHATLETEGVLWDVFAARWECFSYFSIVGIRKEDIFGAINASNGRAAGELNAVRAQQTSQLAEEATSTRAYMESLEYTNIDSIQAMQASFMEQIDRFENASRSTLAQTQQRSKEQVAAISDRQSAGVEGLTAKHLSAMTIATAWTIAAVVALLVAVLLCSAWGTIRVTTSLQAMIQLMEDVAHLRVERVLVLEPSSVVEVARIQAALHVLATRLAEYKSYMPAGLFSCEDAGAAPGNPPPEEQDPGHTERVSSRRSTVSVNRASKVPGAVKLPSVLSPEDHGCNQCSRLSVQWAESSPVSPMRILLRKKVAALAVNVLGFNNLLSEMNDVFITDVCNMYVTTVHETVAVGRGNVDFVVGDQILVTFNAHIPCADPSTTAAGVALDLQSQLRSLLGDQLKFQIGLAFGLTHSGTVGYTKFKCMVAMGEPVKLAATLAHLPDFDGGAVLADLGMEERIKYAFDLRAVDFVLSPDASQSQCIIIQPRKPVFKLISKRRMGEDEWLYQVEPAAPVGDWDDAFNRFLGAGSPEAAHTVLQHYLAAHPEDTVALRLQARRCTLLSPMPEPCPELQSLERTLS
eukprot:EG_transcript_475